MDLWKWIKGLFVSTSAEGTTTVTAGGFAATGALCGAAGGVIGKGMVQATAPATTPPAQKKVAGAAAGAGCGVLLAYGAILVIGALTAPVSGPAVLITCGIAAIAGGAVGGS